MSEGMVAAYAASQSGVITREQLDALGFSRHRLEDMLRRGLWQRLGHGVFLTEATEPTWEQLVWAGYLLGGDCAASGLTAARLHGIYSEPTRPVTFLIRSPRSLTHRGFARFHRGLELRRTQTVAGLRATTAADTIVDCAGLLSGNELEAMVATAIQRRGTSPKAIASAMRGRPRVAQRDLLTTVTGDVAAGAQSPIELIYLRDVERAHQLPTGARQVRVSARNEYVDVHYERYGTVVELDGAAVHVGRRFRDRARDNRNTGSLLRTLRYGLADLRDDACSVALEVGGLLIHGGWTGEPSRCRTCV